MSLAATVKAMAAAGYSAEQIADVVSRMDEEKKARGRAGNARRQAEWRNRERERNAHNGVTGVTGVTDPPPKEIPPTPPKEITPTHSSLRSLSSPEADDGSLIELFPVQAKADDRELLLDIVDIWNREAPGLGLAAVKAITDRRKAAIRARLRELPDLGFADPRAAFRQIMVNIRGSPHCLGQTGGWRADFDFVVSPKGFTKLMENGYAGEAPGHRYGGRR